MSVSLGNAAYEPVDVDLWDVAFQTVPATRTVAKKVDELEDVINAAADPDALVEAIADLVDVRLKSAVKGTRRAATLIKEKWKGDEVTVAQLLDLLRDLEQAERPT